MILHLTSSHVAIIMKNFATSSFTTAIRLALQSSTRYRNVGIRLFPSRQMHARNVSMLPPSAKNNTVSITNGLCSNDAGFRSYSNIKPLTAFSLCRHQSSSATPNRAEVQDRVMAALKKFDKIDATKLTYETHLMKDLGLDSLDHVEMLMAIEDEFAIEIPEDEGEKLVYPKDIVGFIQKAMMADEVRKA